MPVCLVVDESMSMRQLFSVAAKYHGFEVKVAIDGVHALGTCIVEMPDVIVMGWALPKMSGASFLQSLSRLKSRKKPDIVLSSREFRDYDKKLAWQNGVNIILDNPMCADELYLALGAVKKNFEQAA